MPSTPNWFSIDCIAGCFYILSRVFAGRFHADPELNAFWKCDGQAALWLELRAVAAGTLRVTGVGDGWRRALRVVAGPPLPVPQLPVPQLPVPRPCGSSPGPPEPELQGPCGASPVPSEDERERDELPNPLLEPEPEFENELDCLRRHLLAGLEWADLPVTWLKPSEDDELLWWDDLPNPWVELVD